MSALHDAAVRVDVIDAVGRIVAHPERYAPAASSAAIYAIACFAERAWEIAIEAELLVRALALPETGNDADQALKDHAVQAQLQRVSALMAAIRGEATHNDQET